MNTLVKYHDESDQYVYIGIWSPTAWIYIPRKTLVSYEEVAFSVPDQKIDQKCTKTRVAFAGKEIVRRLNEIPGIVQINLLRFLVEVFFEKPEVAQDGETQFEVLNCFSAVLPFSTTAGLVKIRYIEFLHDISTGLPLRPN